MTVGELREILAGLDPELPVGTHANNSDYFSGADERAHGPLRVVRCRHYAGPHVLIGNVSKRNLNGPNWQVVAELDNGPELPEEWRTWTS